LIAGGILMLIYSLINLGNTIITPRSAYHGHEDGAKTAEDLLVERGGTL
jgi:hypothetical protein